MDICFLTCICLKQISQIQTRLCDVVGPGFVSTLPAFMRSSASRPCGHKESSKSSTHCWGRELSTQFAQQFVSAVTAPPLVGCVVWSHVSYLLILFIPIWDIKLSLSCCKNVYTALSPWCIPMTITYFNEV